MKMNRIGQANRLTKELDKLNYYIAGITADVSPIANASRHLLTLQREKVLLKLIKLGVDVTNNKDGETAMAISNDKEETKTP